MSEFSSTGDRAVRVALVFGGRSGEHSISCIAAGGIMRALAGSRYQILPIGITSDGLWTLVSGDPNDWQIGADGVFPTVPSTPGLVGPEVILPASVGEKDFRVVTNGQLKLLGPVDVVFPLLHGPYGEDGTIQGALELIDLPYVGAGVLASALAMDKISTKARLVDAGLPVVPWRAVDARTWDGSPAAVEAASAGLGWPVFVKPSRAGSSLGISRVDQAGDLDQAIRLAGQSDPRLLIETAARGREIECGVLGGRLGAPARAALPGEIRVVAGHDFYDFAAKYVDDTAVRLHCPADLPSEIVEQVRTMAVQAFDAIGAEGLSRVDFFYDPLGPSRAVPQAELMINEINTMPGFTPFSLYARMFEATGWSYPELVAELTELALDRPVGLR